MSVSRSQLPARLLAAWTSALVLTGGLAACPAAPRSTPPDWRPVSLPVPSGRRAVVGDVTACPGGWFAAGGVVNADGTSAPAAWTSRDGVDWAPLPVRPVSYYGQLTVFSTVACRGGDRGVEVVAVGAASGGVHGNPRVATWRGDSGGLVEVPAPFERYGGPDAVTVGRVAAGPAGFLVVGVRVSPRTSLAGAATWVSPDGGAFTLVDSDPALGSDPSASTSAADASAVPGGWVVVGSLTRAGASLRARNPAAWYSTDGATWRRDVVSGAATDDEALARVTPWHGGALAVGVHASRFGAWLRGGTRSGGTGTGARPSADASPGDGGWRPGGRFGTFTGSALPAITGLATGRESVYAAGCDGATYRLWASSDGTDWREMPLPFAMAAGAQRRLLVAAGDGRLMVMADDGTGVRMWLTADRTPR